VSEHSQEVWIGGALTLLGLFITNLFSFFAGKGKSNADLQSVINSSMKQLMEELKAEHHNCKTDLAAMRQELISLENQLRRQGIDVVVRPAPSAIVFTPKPEPEEPPHG